MKPINDFDNFITMKLQFCIDRQTAKIEKTATILKSFITFSGNWMVIYKTDKIIDKTYTVYTEMTYSSEGKWISTALYGFYENDTLSDMKELILP